MLKISKNIHDKNNPPIDIKAPANGRIKYIYH